MYSVTISDKINFDSKQICALTNKTIGSGYFVEVKISTDIWGFYFSKKGIEDIGLNSEDLEKANDYRECFYGRCPEFIRYPYRLLSDIRFAISNYY